LVATEKVFPVATEMGWPVQVPQNQRSGEPALSQISTPTTDHVAPELVHDRAISGPCALPDADMAKVAVVPPVV